MLTRNFLNKFKFSSCQLFVYLEQQMNFMIFDILKCFKV